MNGLEKPQKKLMNKFLSWLKGNGRPVSGIVLVTLGVFIVFRAREIVFNLILFTVGFVLIYYGIYFLGFTKIIDFINVMGNRVKNLFKQ